MVVFLLFEQSQRLECASPYDALSLYAFPDDFILSFEHQISRVQGIVFSIFFNDERRQLLSISRGSQATLPPPTSKPAKQEFRRVAQDQQSQRYPSQNQRKNAIDEPVSSAHLRQLRVGVAAYPCWIHLARNAGSKSSPSHTAGDI
jgi:hypothetical protein